MTTASGVIAKANRPNIFAVAVWIICKTKSEKTIDILLCHPEAMILYDLLYLERSPINQCNPVDTTGHMIHNIMQISPKHISIILVLLLAVLAASDRSSVIENQITELMQHIRGKSVAMLTNPTSVDGNMAPLFERILALSSTYNVTFKCFFAPEHGLRGDHQDGAGD